MGIQTSMLDNFNVDKDRFSDVKAEFTSFLHHHPEVLPPEISKVALDAADKIQAQSDQYLIRSSSSTASIDTRSIVYQLMTKPSPAPEKVSQPVHKHSNTICRNGGDTSQCIKD